MPQVHTALNTLLNNHLTLSAAQISQGSISHNYIRDLLVNRNERDSSFPLFVDGDFLSGSYARGTKIFPLNDIDVMMVMDGTGLIPLDKGQYLNAEVRGSGEQGNPILQHFGENGLLSSKKVLELFRDVLMESHPMSKIKEDGQAVNVWLDSYKLGIDVVPCFHIVPSDGSQDFYYIPAGNDKDYWLKTNPKIDEKISENYQKYHNNQFSGLVRLLKHWNRDYNAERLQSYHLETLSWYVFSGIPTKIQHYGDALNFFFENVTQYLAIACPDATKLGDPIDQYLSPENRQKTLQRIAETSSLINTVSMLGLGNPERKLKAWKSVLGDKFVI
ncbi:MAG: hypothetical protein AAB874_02040 [Patescibacteria group bacterium]